MELKVLDMMVLITYDVSVTTDAGKTRLRKVAKGRGLNLWLFIY